MGVFWLFLPLSAGCGWQGSSKCILLTSSIHLLIRRVIPGGWHQTIPLPRVVQGWLKRLPSVRVITQKFWRLKRYLPCPSLQTSFWIRSSFFQPSVSCSCPGSAVVSLHVTLLWNHLHTQAAWRSTLRHPNLQRKHSGSSVHQTTGPQTTASY